MDLIVVAMEKSESEEMVHDDGSMSQLLWQHLSSQVIFFVLFQFASFPHMVLALNEKVSILVSFSSYVKSFNKIYNFPIFSISRVCRFVFLRFFTFAFSIAQGQKSTKRTRSSYVGSIAVHIW